MKRTFFAVALSLAALVSASAAEPTITVNDVILINGALNRMNCAEKVIKDGQKETFICEPYKLSAGFAWSIATNLRKTADVVTQFQKVRNEAILKLDRKSDGDPTEAARAKFSLDERAWLDAPVTDVKFDRFKKADVEPLNLAPSVISALLPIID